MVRIIKITAFNSISADDTEIVSWYGMAPLSLAVSVFYIVRSYDRVMELAPQVPCPAQLSYVNKFHLAKT